MIVFREKQFALPLVLIPALKGIATGITALGTAYSVKQAHDKHKLDKAHYAQAKADNQKIISALNEVNATGDPDKMVQAYQLVGNAAAQQSAQLPSQQNTTDSTSPAEQKTYSLAGIKAGIKVMGSLLKGSKKTLVGGTLAGAGIGVAGYGADKYIQHDKAKRAGLSAPTASPTSQQLTLKKFSLVRKVGKTLWEGAKKNKGMIGISAAMTAVPTIAMYEMEKKSEGQQIKSTIPEKKESTDKTFSKVALIKHAVSGLKGIGSSLKGMGSSIKSGFKSFKAKPGESILSGVSSFAGGGGKSGVTKFGDDLIKHSKTHGFKSGEKLGNFIKNNPKTALAASVPVGAAVMAGTWDAGQKATEAVLKKVDKNAFKHRDSQLETIN